MRVGMCDECLRNDLPADRLIAAGPSVQVYITFVERAGNDDQHQDARRLPHQAFASWSIRVGVHRSCVPFSLLPICGIHGAKDRDRPSRYTAQL